MFPKRQLIIGKSEQEPLPAEKRQGKVHLTCTALWRRIVTVHGRWGTDICGNAVEKLRSRLYLAHGCKVTPPNWAPTSL